MFEEEIEEKETPEKDPPKTGRFACAHGRMPVSYVYGSDYPTCWLHSAQKQVFT